LLKKLSKEERTEKAERHIYDALYLRTVRNDIDLLQRRILKVLWDFVNKELWDSFIW